MPSAHPQPDQGSSLGYDSEHLHIDIAEPATDVFRLVRKAEGGVEVFSNSSLICERTHAASP
jgi:hypothetical protein